MYGMLSDMVIVGGFQRTPYIALAGGVGTLSLSILWLVVLSAPVAVLLMFGVNFSVASPDVGDQCNALHLRPTGC